MTALWIVAGLVAVLIIWAVVQAIAQRFQDNAFHKRLERDWDARQAADREWLNTALAQRLLRDGPEGPECARQAFAWLKARIGKELDISYSVSGTSSGGDAGTWMVQPPAIERADGDSGRLQWWLNLASGSPFQLLRPGAIPDISISPGKMVYRHGHAVTEDGNATLAASDADVDEWLTYTFADKG